MAAGETLTLEYDNTYSAKRDITLKVKWAFRTEGSDIGFSVHYEGEKKKSMEFLNPYKKVDSHEGSFKLENSGIYVLTFDNSFSLYKTKGFAYSITLSPI